MVLSLFIFYFVVVIIIKFINILQNTYFIHKMKQFSITKKVAKHGTQAIIVIPRVLEQELKPGTVVELKINILKEVENEFE